MSDLTEEARRLLDSGNGYEAAAATAAVAQAEALERIATALENGYALAYDETAGQRL